MNFEQRDEDDLHGLLSWFKAPIENAKAYPGGFDVEVPATGSAYSPQAGNAVLNFSDGSVRLSGGSLTEDILNIIVLNSNSKVANMSANKLTLNITTPLGLMKGTVVDPVSGKTLKFEGAVNQKQNLGSGYFINGAQSGTVRFGP
jgi:hypothetical protein